MRRARLRHREGALTAELARVRVGGGIGQVPARLAPEAVVPLTCGFCSTGCSLDAHMRDGVAVNLTPTPSYPVNRGHACPKGWAALEPLGARDRATKPLLRNARGRFEPIDWGTALRVFVDRVRAVQETHGPEAMAFLSTGQIVTEEMALLGALAKFGMGMMHGDGNTRQCMATSVVAYKETFGFDAPPYTYADLEESDVVVLWGSNLAIAHPILWGRLRSNRHRPCLVVVDPRRTETAAAATHHLALRPKSDLVLAYGLAHLLIRNGHVDRAFVARHTDGFEEFAAHVERFTPEHVAAATGLARADLERTAEVIGRGERVSLWWTMGVNQSHEGVRTAQALIALCLLTGNIGRPGTGPNSVTGQCNAMGSRLFANTTCLLGGHDFGDPAHRERVARILGIDAGLIPHEPSWPYDRIMEGIARGEIRGLWVIATNTAHSWINQTDCHDLLDRLDFLVVQDMYATTETARRAHLVLPAAGWGEKDGTFVNSERRIATVRKVARAPGDALADFWIFKAIADAWGCGPMFERWSSPETTFAILRELSRGRPCDFTGIRDYAALDDAGGIQWPYPEDAPDPRPERRLFGDGRFYTPDGRARFVFGEPGPPLETPGGRYPFVLLTGRGNAAEWHTGTRTRKSGQLRGLSADTPYVEVNPRDARASGIAPNAWVRVVSARGSMRARAVLTNSVAPGQVFVPMHHAHTNRLTFPGFDPHSRQPSYKYAAVALHPEAAHEKDRR